MKAILVTGSAGFIGSRDTNLSPVTPCHSLPVPCHSLSLSPCHFYAQAERWGLIQKLYNRKNKVREYPMMSGPAPCHPEI